MTGQPVLIKKSRVTKLSNVHVKIMTDEPAQRVRAKRWCVTINNYTKGDVAMFEVIKPKCDYWIYGKEVGEQGTPHLQCYIIFKDVKTAKQCHCIFPSRGHWSKANGTSEQNHTYCSKDGDFEEYGTIPEEPSVKGGKATADKWLAAKELAMKGDIFEIDPKILISHYKNFKLIRADTKKVPEDLDWTIPPNVWIYGPTRTGKSWRARKEIIGDNPFYIKNAANKWWDKYDGEKYVLIEDMDLTHHYQGKHCSPY